MTFNPMMLLPFLKLLGGRPPGTGTSGGLEGMIGKDYSLNPLIPQGGGGGQGGGIMGGGLVPGMMGQAIPKPMGQAPQVPPVDFRQQGPPPEAPSAGLMTPEWLGEDDKMEELRRLLSGLMA